MATGKYKPGEWTLDLYGTEPAIRTNEGHVVVPRIWGSMDDAYALVAARETLAACKAASLELNYLAEQTAAREGGSVRNTLALVNSAIAKATVEPT